MATGVKPRDDEVQFTRTDIEAIQDAMKSKKFRDLLTEYCDEVRDPANQALYQKEMTQLEKERGYDVTFINPKGSYVIKTSVAGDRKAFINICSNENIDKPSCKVQEVNGQKGMNWQIPYSIIPPREDYNHNRQRCVIYDVVFHPDTLRMAQVNKQFRELVNNTAFDGLRKTYDIHLDSNNCRYPKSHYKGMNIPAVIRKEDPNFIPPENDEEIDQNTSEVLEKLYPQKNYTPKATPEQQIPSEMKTEPNELKKHKHKKGKTDFTHVTENGYTVPKYVIKQQKALDFQDFTYGKDCKQYSAIPSHIVVEVNLPLLTSTVDCVLDVQEKSLSLVSEKPAKYKLNIPLPYSVNDECGHAKFDKTKRLLIVTLPVIRKNSVGNEPKPVKIDSGVESEENSGSQSDEEHSKSDFIVELSSVSAETVKPSSVQTDSNEDQFLDVSLGYLLPPYTHNALDDIIAFTFHVKNTDPDSVKVRNDGNKVYIKFTTVGSGFVPVHYAALIIFDEGIKFDNATGEAWDNNVILQMEIADVAPQKFQIGLNKDSLALEYFDVSQTKKNNVKQEIIQHVAATQEDTTPVVEVTNLGTETNIIVSSTSEDYDEDDIESPTELEKEIVWTDSGNENGAKSILRKKFMMRSFSESSVGDVASSMDYISSDCIPEESSLKKTVRFNDVIARQFYRYNSSIEGQKKKNQRKKSKKRNQDRRKSESEAEDDITNISKSTKPRIKSALKPRRDSGLADTSDAEAEWKSKPECELSDGNVKEKEYNGNIDNNIDDDAFTSGPNGIDIKQSNDSGPAIWKSTDSKPTKIPKSKKREPVTCDNIKHNTDLYNPDKLNKGQYLEVMFKNDLIFDLDM